MDDLFSDDLFIRKYGSWRKYLDEVKYLLLKEEVGMEEFLFEAYAERIEPSKALEIWDSYTEE